MGGLLIIFNGFSRFTAAPLTANLSFSGAATKRTATGLSGTLSLSGLQVIRTKPNFTAALTFLGEHNKTSFKLFTKSMTMLTKLFVPPFHFYTGPFRHAARGFFRAVHRGRDLITQDRNLH